MNPLDVLGPKHGPCGICGHPDARHRIADAIMSRLCSGEPIAEIADDYGYDEEKLTTLIEHLRTKNGSLLD